MPKQPNRYTQLIEHIFHSHYTPGADRVRFSRSELITVANELNVKLPLNLGDVTYTFRYRANLPESIRTLVPEGMIWVIKSVGRSLYEFTLVKDFHIAVNDMLIETKVPDATPGIVSLYALGDEQALLTKIRYNRLIDIFTGVTCYSLQNHLRTTVPQVGQVETDELYVGIDKRGVHYVLPVQAKSKKERLGAVQIEQDISLCASKYHGLICRPIGAQLIEEYFIALFEFEMTDEGIKLAAERHYRLVPPDSIEPSDLERYKKRGPENP
jgi:hypothetical protein